jgi:hypothetical protein
MRTPLAAPKRNANNVKALQAAADACGFAEERRGDLLR